MTSVRSDANPDDIIRVLTLGFCADPVMRWLYPQPQNYLEHFSIVLKLFDGAAFDNQAALSVTDGCAAAFWLPPNTHPGGNGLKARFAHCRQHLGAYKVPRAVQLVDTVPITASGKIMRHMLKAIDDGSRGDQA